MGRKLILTLPAVLVLFWAGMASAANILIHAEAEPEIAPGFIQVGEDFTIDIYMQNTSGTNCLGFSATWELAGSNGLTNIIHRDIGGQTSLGSDGSVLMLNGFGVFEYWTVLNLMRLDSWDGSLPDTVNHTTAGLPPASWPASDDQDLIRYQIGLHSDQTGMLCIDSISHSNDTYNWLWLAPSVPEFNGPYCWTISDGVPPVIGLSVDSMAFSGVTGNPPPAPQNLVVSNTGAGTLNWTGTWSSSWLNISPAFGAATGIPTNVQVSINTSGLAAGVYRDTIVISSATATNSPQIVPVKLTMTEPPPTISLSSSQFYFSAVADSSNPDDQTLHVANTGAGTLNWTATNSESWLDIFPTSGTDDGDITLSVDITGLPYGLYYDTVVVSDPAATNNPRRAAVRLEVASGLPVLAVDSPSIYIIVEIPGGSPPNRQFTVMNAGGGSMTYQLNESSPRILNMTPLSGTVPQTVDVEFKILNGNPPQDFFDTVWVSSPEAINSPIPVEFHFHIVADAAEIFVSPDSLYNEYYECSQGLGIFELPQFFTVYNSGGDTFEWNITHKPIWLMLTANSGTHGTQVYYTYLYDGYDAGFYEDSIVIYCENALVNTYVLPVQMRILPTDVTPSVYVSSKNYVFTVQENKTGRPKIMNVNNYNPGCMSWEFNEDLSWITFNIDSTNDRRYPWLVELVPNGYGMTLGTYTGAGQITSPDADNVPIDINFTLKVWKLHGDCNWDGLINLNDLLWMIYWIYYTWDNPMPENIVADCNCDNHFDLLDIQELINYLYFGGSPLCGNPY